MSDRPQDTPIFDPPVSDRPTTEAEYASTETARRFDESEGEAPRTDVAREQGSQVAGSAKSEARNVAGTATQQAARVADEAKVQGRHLASEASTQLKQQAQGQTERAASFAQDLAGQFRALSEGRTEEAGEVGRYAQQATDQIERFASSLNERGFDGLVDDVTSFARRRPGLFLAGAAAAGFLTGRLVRGARDASSSDSSFSSSSSYSSPPSYSSATPPVGTAPAEPYLAPDAPEAPIGSSRSGAESF